MGSVMRILVCGGRKWSDTKSVYKCLDIFHKQEPINVVIEGNAHGVDRIAGYWARKNNIDNLKFSADWNKFGKRAGPLRNKQMLNEGRPDLVIAFPGGRGTKNMVELALRQDVPVMFATGIFQEAIALIREANS
jgi:hypothetical protein